MIYLDLSATGLTGSIFQNVQLVALKQLYLDFCPKIIYLHFSRQTFQNLRKLSIFGSYNIETLDISTIDVKELVKHNGTETENQITDYANKRGLKVTNWLVTKKHMAKGMPMMLSPIRLTSLTDRD